MGETAQATILLVDDAEAGRYATARILNRAGFQVIEGACGADCLRLARGPQTPDLIVLDIHMPDLDGFEVCRRLKADPATASIPVLHLTATCQDQYDKVLGLNCGADAFLTQPVPANELVATIASLLRVRQSEKQYRLLFENMKDAFFLAQPVYKAGQAVDWRFLDANAAYAAMTGFSLDQVIGRLNSELFSGGEPLWCEIIAQVARTGEPANLEAYSESRGRWYNVRYYSPQPGFAAAVTSDITEQKRAAAEIERLARFPQENPTPVLRIQADGVLLYYNQAAQAIAADWVLGEKQRVHDSILRVVSEVLKLGQCHEREMEIQGRTYLLTFRPFPEAGYVNVYGRDETERKQAEDALRQAAESYERQVRLFDGVASTTPDFVYIFDLEGRFIYANRRLLEVWGMKLPDVIGKTCRELGYEQWHHDMHMREIAQVIQTKAPIKGEVPFKAPLTGSFGIYEYIFTPVIGPDGEVELIAGTTRDVTERKTGEEALRQSEQKLRVAMRAADLGTWTYTFDDNICLYDEQAQKLYGLNEPAILHDAEGVKKLFHPDDIPLMWERVQAAINPAGDGHYQVEYRILAPESGVRWLNAWGQVEFEGEGGQRHPVRMVGASRDITEQKTAAETLARERELLAGIIDNIPVLLCIWDPNLKMFRFNRHLREVLGWTEADAREGDFMAKVYPDPAYRQSVIDYMQSLEGGWRDLKCTTKDGSEVDVSWANVCMADDTSIGIGIDIRARKQAEEELHHANTMLNAINLNTPALVALKDRESRIVYCNPSMLEVIGKPEAEVIGRNDIEFLGEEQGLPVMLNDRRVMDSGTTEQVEEYALGRVFHVIKTPFRDEAGNVTGIVVIGTDITERKRMEDALREANERLVEADRRKDEFLAMLAHELRNPLAPVRNAVHILRAAEGRPDILRRQQEIIDRQTTHMARLLDDLLDVSRITRGKITLQKQPLAVADVLLHVVETVTPLLRSRHHTLHFDPPREELRVEGDLDRLAQAVGNVLINAAKYTDEGGRIWLEAEREGGQAIIRIRDTGIGIAPEILPQVFELFAQADHSLERSQGGLGIGLTMVKRLVELHGGTIEARSDGIGRGSEFILRLPALPEEPLPGQRLPIPAVAKVNGKVSRRVLVVDDLADAAVSLGELLEIWGHEVRTANDGQEALEILSNFLPEVVLMDIGMPGMNGCEVARRIRQQECGRHVRLVALTGYGQRQDKEETRAAGFDDHLVKPVDLSALRLLLTHIAN